VWPESLQKTHIDRNETGQLLGFCGKPKYGVKPLWMKPAKYVGKDIYGHQFILLEDPDRCSYIEKPLIEKK
jgi:hypothetical protein